ncbi:MAG: AsmA family protein [Sphingobacteriales bacterium]|nr:MAG: AsmA family protein [Sphingobacteriales bacterium]
MRWLKLALKIIGGFILLMLILFACVIGYVNLNKKAVLKAITEQLNDNISGTLSIENMEPTLIRGFPGVSISLQNVLLRDSLWDVHKHDLLRAKEIYVSVNAFSIIKGAPRIRDVSINEANIYLFTDSNGYTNTRLFTPKEHRDTSKKKAQPRINHLYFNNVNLVFENKTKNKLFQLDIKNLETVLDYKLEGGWDANIDLNALVKQFNFNTDKGSFLKNKRLVTDLKISYDKAKQTLNIPEQEIEIDDDEIMLGGQFVFATTPSTFELNIKANNIAYKNATALLSPSISGKINILDFEDPIDLQASLKGSMKYRDTPLVKVDWQVKDNVFKTPGGDIKKCSFNGTFFNEYVTGNGRSDRNAVVTLTGLKGEWSAIPFSSDTIRVTNLISPVLQGRFMSKFAVTKLNPIIGTSTFHFDKGNVDVNLLYKAGIRNNDTTEPYIFGTIRLTNAAMTYVPRKMAFTNTSATLKFMGSDLFLDNVKLQKGNTQLAMQGSLKNFLNLYYKAPEKILLDWHVRSPLINLSDFKSFLEKRNDSLKAEQPKKSLATNATKISTQLNKVLDQSSVHMDVKVDKLVYQKFEATDINADVTLTNTDITLKNFIVKHADGSLKMDIRLLQQGLVNNFTVKTNVSHVNIAKFLYAFDNFGQTSITDRNVNGKLTANIDVSGAVKDDGKLMPRSFNGTASFEFEDGALVQFEPLKKISKFVFRNRNLDDIRFNTIKNKFDIKGDKITIYPMSIESSAINMNIEGIYSFAATGTDINVDIPLRNPGKDELIEDEELKNERNMKGIVVHLKAIDGEDGKVKIKWNRKNDAVGTDSTTVPEQAPKKKKKGLRIFKK